MTEPADFAEETETRTMNPDEIARTLAAMDAVEPFEMTDEERADTEADRQARREWEKARFNEHADRLRGMWDREDSSEGEESRRDNIEAVREPMGMGGGAA